MAKSRSVKKSKAVFWQTVLFTALILGTGLVLAIWGGNRLADQLPRFGPGIRTALLTFILWLVVSTGVRSLHALNKKRSLGSLLAGGSLTGIFGSLACFSFVRVLAVFREGSSLEAAFDLWNMLYFAGLGIVVSILAVINLRTKNKSLGNFLELLVLGAVLFSILYFSR